MQVGLDLWGAVLHIWKQINISLSSNVLLSMNDVGYQTCGFPFYLFDLDKLSGCISHMSIKNPKFANLIYKSLYTLFVNEVFPMSGKAGNNEYNENKVFFKFFILFVF